MSSKELARNTNEFLSQMKHSLNNHFFDGERYQSLIGEQGLYTVLNQLQLNRSIVQPPIPFEDKQNEAPPHDFDDARDLHGFRMQKWDSVIDDFADDDDDDIEGLADRLDELSLGTAMELKVGKIISEQQGTNCIPHEKQTELYLTQKNCKQLLAKPHQVYIQQEFFHRVEVHVLKSSQCLFSFCKFLVNKPNQRQSCIARE